MCVVTTGMCAVKSSEDRHVCNLSPFLYLLIFFHICASENRHVRRDEEEEETVAAVDAATAVAVDVVVDAARTTLAPLMHQRKGFAPRLAPTFLITVRRMPQIK